MKQRDSFETRVTRTEQMRLLGHANTKPCCEIQCEALEFSKQHQWLADLNEF